MELWIVADESTRQEMMACTISATTDLHWIESLAQLAPASARFVIVDLVFDRSNNQRLQQLIDSGASLVLINNVTDTCDGWPHHLIRFNGWPGFLRRPVAEMTGGNDDTRQQAAAVMQALGRTVEWVPDICGLLSARVIAMIINEAYFALEENISTAAEIDTAMKLGTNYPWGPFEWAELLNIRNVLELLEKLAAEQTRYQPSALLKQKALA